MCTYRAVLEPFQRVGQWVSSESVQHGCGQRNAQRLFDYDEIVFRHAKRMHVSGVQRPPAFDGSHDAHLIEHLIRRVPASGFWDNE